MEKHVSGQSVCLDSRAEVSEDLHLDLLDRQRYDATVEVGVVVVVGPLMVPVDLMEGIDLELVLKHGREEVGTTEGQQIEMAEPQAEAEGGAGSVAVG